MAEQRASDLDRFPRPSVAVDVAVMTATPEHGLGVLLHRRSGDRQGQWALPGRFLRERERLADAVTATMREKCGLPPQSLAGVWPRQLHVFDDPARDDRGWVLSVAHLLALPFDELDAALVSRDDLVVARTSGERTWLPGRQRALPYGQGDIVRLAVDELRRRYESEPDPEGLLGMDEFTLSELRMVHEAVLGEERQVDTFRRRMEPLLVATGEVTSGGPGRPAALYRRT